MSVKINVDPAVSQIHGGQRVFEVDGGTVGQCLDRLVEQLPVIKEELFDENGRLQIYVDIYVNRRSVSRKELSRPVKDGDEIDILFIVDDG